MKKTPPDPSRSPRSTAWRLAALLGLAALGLPASAAVYLRGNTLGYPPERTTKTILVLADSTQQGKIWQLTDATGKVVRSGILGSSLCGVTNQSPFEAHHAIELGTLRDTGTYALSVPGAAPFEVRIRKNPYSFFAAKTLGHLSLMRSGTDQVGFRRPSHLGDSASIPMRPLVPEDGSWSLDGTRKPLDLTGGWYDAGDYIKFTSTTAQTTYFLLRAWETNPGLLGAGWVGGDPAVLQEARVGLKYLLKTHPDDSTFVIQVGDGLDHEQGQRLPQDDLLDGKRPALCALSPLHMGITSATLALGASVFRERDPSFAAACSTQAVRILLHGSAPGVARTTYYSGSPINAFYKDDNVYDNLGMGAAELWRLTGEMRWKTLARQWSDSAGTQGWINWGNWAIPLNARLIGDSASSALLRKDMQGMASYGRNAAKPWNLPMAQYWDPIEPYFSWVGIAADRAQAGDTSWLAQAWDTWDYVLGRNNWGTSFLLSKNVPNHASAIYNQIYLLLNEFPEGAISLGPGGTSYFTSMRNNFSLTQAELDRAEPFNPTAAVFYDNPTVFLNTETTIDNPATFLFALATLSRLTGDSVPGAAPASVDKPAVLPTYDAAPLPIAKSRWTAFDDASDSGSSRAALDLVSDTLVRATLEVKSSDILKYPYAGLSSEPFSKEIRDMDWSGAAGIRLRGDLPKGIRLWVQLPTDSIKDYDFYGVWLVGKGDTIYDIPFDSLAQRGWGIAKPLVRSQIYSFEMLGLSVSPSFSLGVRSLSLLHAQATGIGASRDIVPARALWTGGGRLHWALSGSQPAAIWDVEVSGRRSLLAPGVTGTGSLELGRLSAGMHFLMLEQGGVRRTVPYVHP